MKLILNTDDLQTMLAAMAEKRAKSDKDLPDQELGLEASIRNAVKYKQQVVVENG